MNHLQCLAVLYIVDSCRQQRRLKALKLIVKIHSGLGLNPSTGKQKVFNAGGKQLFIIITSL